MVPVGFPTKGLATTGGLLAIFVGALAPLEAASPSGLGGVVPLLVAVALSPHPGACRWTAPAPDYVVYAYSHHERITLRRLAQRYGGSCALEAFLSRFIDLHEVVRRVVVLPTESTRFKVVARFVGFDWRDTNPGGAESMAWWAEYTADPVGNAAFRDRVLAYNEDDLRATLSVVDGLSHRARVVI